MIGQEDALIILDIDFGEHHDSWQEPQSCVDTRQRDATSEVCSLDWKLEHIADDSSLICNMFQLVEYYLHLLVEFPACCCGDFKNILG